MPIIVLTNSYPSCFRLSSFLLLPPPSQLLDALGALRFAFPRTFILLAEKLGFIIIDVFDAGSIKPVNNGSKNRIRAS